MSCYQRGNVFYVEIRRQSLRIRCSTGTTRKARAKVMDRLVHDLHDDGRHDLLGLLAARRITLPDLYDRYYTDRDGLWQWVADASSPPLAPLVEEWLSALPGMVTRHGRRFAASSVERYRVSWRGILGALPDAARVADLTDGFMASYRTRGKAVGGRDRYDTGGVLSAATVNRDAAAVKAFCTWLETVKGIPFKRPRMVHEKEPQGRIIWLDGPELAAFRAHCPPEWWPYFAVLFYCGLRCGEAAGLRGGDVQVRERRIDVHETHRRTKTAASVRTVPFPPQLVTVLAHQLHGVGANDLVFPGAQDRRYRRVWDQVCRAAGITNATPRDARHTYGVHAAIAGVPAVRLMSLMGHSNIKITMRYMQHAPSAFMDQDAGDIYTSMETDQEGAARRRAALKGA